MMAMNTRVFFIPLKCKKRGKVLEWNCRKIKRDGPLTSHLFKIKHYVQSLTTMRSKGFIWLKLFHSH